MRDVSWKAVLFLLSVPQRMGWPFAVSDVVLATVAFTTAGQLEPWLVAVLFGREGATSVERAQTGVEWTQTAKVYDPRMAALKRKARPVPVPRDGGRLRAASRA